MTEFVASTGTVWGLIEAAAREYPDRVLFRDDHGRSLTAAGLRVAAEQVAAGLVTASGPVRPGQVVSWQLPTVLEAPVLLAALARLGAVQNPLIATLRERELGYITEQVGTTLFITPETWRGFDHAAAARRLGLETLAIDLASGSEVDPDPNDPGLRLPTGDPATLPPPPVAADEPRWIYYSSGSTAEPKGARHTDASIIAGSYAMTDRLGIADGDVYPIAWPYPHIGGSSMTTAVLRAGGTLVLFDTFDPAVTGERMAAYAPTILGSATPFFRTYLAAQQRHGREPLYPRLRALTAGGAPTPTELVEELQAVFGVPVLNSYGLTEFPIAAGLAPEDPPEQLAASVGRPSPGVQVRLVDGELRLKGPQCCAGYVAAGPGDVALDGFDADGWFRTGDLATMVDGYLRITGRLKDVIIRNAENISAPEVEAALLRHADVADVAVFGMPDPRTGERVCAVLVTRSGGELTIDDIAAHCHGFGLARHKTPEQIACVEGLPRNGMGKVLKQQLAGLLAERPSVGRATPAERTG